MRILIHLFFGFILCSFQAKGQVSFYKYFSGTGYDTGQGISQLEDSSYIVTGLSGSFGEDSEAFLLKLTKQGQYQWSNHYGGNEADWGRRVLYNQDLGYYIVGNSNSYSSGDYDALVVKTDLQGNQLWSKTYGTGNWEQINDAVFASDSGIVMVGMTQALIGGGSDIYMARLNQNGDTLWTKTIGGVGQDVANTIINVEDSMFIVGGQYFNQDSLLSKGFLMKINQNGQVVWMNQIGDNGSFGITDITLFTNKIYATGWKWDPLLNEHDNYSGRYELNGALYYESVFVNQGDVILDELTFNGNLSKLYIGYRNENFSSTLFGLDVTLGRFNSNFDWDNGPVYINNLEDEKVEQFMATSDGGVIAVGWTSGLLAVGNYPVGGSKVYVIKIGPNDEIPITTGIQPINALVGIVEAASDAKNIYPNPTKGNLTLEGFTTPIQYTVFSSLGEVVYDGVAFDNQLLLDFLNVGMYLVKIKDEPTIFRLSKIE
jgi:hypothetical protein